MHHRYRRLGIGGVIIMILVLGEARFRWEMTKPATPELLPVKQVVATADYLDLTGVLLSGPHAMTWNRRSQTLAHNTDYLYGRMYDITYPSAIKRLNAQHFPIDIILESEKFQQYGDDFAKLTNQLSVNPQIQLYPDTDLGVIYTHAKTFVGNHWRTIQTANLNRTSFFDNREHFFLSENTKIRDDLVALFLLDTSKIQDPDTDMTEEYKQRFLTASPNLVVCPLNCRSVIESLLTRAQDRIWISTQYVMDSTLLRILANKQDIDLRIRSNKFDNNRELQATIYPEHLIWEDKIYNHDKLIIADDIMLIGSMNLSANSLDNNREIGIILTNPTYIQQVESLFY